MSSEGTKIGCGAPRLSLIHIYPASEEYKLFLQLRADFPGLTIIRKTRRAPKKARPTKNLTYKHMEQYMSCLLYPSRCV